ncbi:IS5 family transposase [Arenibacter algicola]|uniref:Transposase n=1 Tax=Arenibacter algicola TaxID=616991 RepID=A0A221UWM0_9FLAO|nr:transposase [Arenibacter algicola]ASO05684.1 transposase [Arenibacter algicola]ASO05779.1 transposase [Arenibacter algicola]
MLAKPKIQNQASLFFTLEETLNQKHPLYILSNRVDWELFDREFSPLYCQDNGRPAKPIRLMVGLVILKHLRDISDEGIVEQWAENLYYQYFCGQQEFSSCEPCDASELVHFRKRIGEPGVELILKESIRINGDDSNDGQVSIDTTVQEKNITFPTDAKLHRKIIKKCLAIAKKERLPVRQSYTRTLKKLGVDQRFRNHPRNKSKARKADKKVRTIAGRLVRELERNLKPGSIYRADLELCKQVLAQKRTSKNKIYSLHEPETQCISKGKEHKKYEFGNKASFVYTRNTGVIVGAMGFRNEFDGHTLEPTLEQTERLVGKAPKEAAVDRGYKGRKQIGDTQIQLPKPFNDKTQTKYRQKKLKEAHRKRAAIEPVIGHLKADHRLGRNFYKGIVGDNINIMLAAAAFNFKRMMNKWKVTSCRFFRELYSLFKFMIYRSILDKTAF